MAPTLGHFVLHSNVLPPVTAGNYELEAEQSGTPFDVHTEQAHVSVTSPRYTMPTDQILSTFPPANADGAFGDRLPQIVLKRRTLPWERNPAGAVGVSTTPWLALVVVAEGEAELQTGKPVADCVTPDTALLEPTDRDTEQGNYLAVTESVVRKIFPTAEDLPLLTHVREVDVADTELAGGDDDGWMAVVLANRLPVFDDTNGLPVRYLACLVNVEGQLEALPPPSQPVNTFVFELAADYRYLAEADAHPDTWVTGGAPSIRADLLDDVGPIEPGAAHSEAGAAVRTGRAVSESRLPSIGAALDGANARSTSSSQWETAPSVTDQVTSAAFATDAPERVRHTMSIGFHYPIEVSVIEPVLRFPVLAHWSFTTSEGATFETLMQGLDVGLIGTTPAPDPAAPPRPATSDVVATGHVRLDHTTRRGDATSAWYRGPLVPHPTARTGPDGRLPLAHSADQLRAVVPDGLEDVGVAAAFEIGRLLALSQLSVTAGLLRFRKDHFGIARIREAVETYVPFEFGDHIDEVVDLGHLVSTMFLDSLAGDPVKVAGPRRPIADPGRPIPELDGLSQNRLDAVVAGGLGIDLGKLRKQSEAVGVVAALVDTQVPVQRTAELGDAAVTRLTESLDSMVRRVAGVAALPDLDIGAADPLDELAERLRTQPEPEGEAD